MHKQAAIYTSIFGGYEALLPQEKIPGADYICFTDRNISSRTWDVRIVKPVSLDMGRASRHPKILPHRYLGDYEISIYIDGNYLVVGDAVTLARKALARTALAAFPNSKTRYGKACIYEEHRCITNSGEKTGKYKDDPAIMAAQINRYRQERYPENNGLITASILFRRHNDPTVIAVMERWWSELERGSKRDQLSFNYAAWREKFQYTEINGDLRDNCCFFMIGKHRKSYAGKLFRYRLRRMLGLKKHSAPLSIIPPSGQAKLL